MTEETPDISIIVVMYNMAREAPRTLYSLSGAYQRDIDPKKYEVIVVDNGSTPPLDPQTLASLAGNFRLMRIDRAPVSPVPGINQAIAAARGRLIGVFIDGARIASPGLIATAGMADRIADRTVILTLGFHLGPKMQQKSMREGYDQKAEDALLEKSGWIDDGHRLFDISVLAASSANGWFRPLAESNALFMRATLWRETDGFDGRFVSPGGGLANLDLLSRALALPHVTPVTLLGEATFHQFHGGISTNAEIDTWETFHAEYIAIRGHGYQVPTYRSLFVGSVPSSVLPWLHVSSQGKPSAAIDSSRSADGAGTVTE